MRPSLTRAGGGLALLVVAACALLFVADVWRRPHHQQWDFHTYHYASAAQAAGLDAYDPASISQVSNKRWTPAFLYPPLTLHLFSVLRLLDYPVAARVWLLLKRALSGVMVLQWHRLFTRLAPPVVCAVFLCFALGATFAWDLKAGNISIVEQFLLCTAFGCLLRDRPRAFCALLLAHHLAAPDQFARCVLQAVTMNDLGGRHNAGLLAFLKDMSGGGGKGPLVACAAILLLAVALVARRVVRALPAPAVDRPPALALGLLAVLLRCPGDRALDR